MNTTEVYGLIGAVLVLAGLVAALLWAGVLAISASLSVKIVPRWQRDAAPPAKQKGNRGPDGRFLPRVVADGQKAS